MQKIPWKKVEWTRSRDEFMQVLLLPFEIASMRTH